MDQPTDAPGVLRDLINRWHSEGQPPAEVALENVRGEWTASTDAFLEHMAGPDGEGDILPSAEREAVQEITGQEVGTYGGAATALLATLQLPTDG
jgi:hypothetical protein